MMQAKPAKHGNQNRDIPRGVVIITVTLVVRDPQGVQLGAQTGRLIREQTTIPRSHTTQKASGQRKVKQGDHLLTPGAYQHKSANSSQTCSGDQPLTLVRSTSCNFAYKFLAGSISQKQTPGCLCLAIFQNFGLLQSFDSSHQ